MISFYKAKKPKRITFDSDRKSYFFVYLLKMRKTKKIAHTYQLEWVQFAVEQKVQFNADKPFFN